jgi:2-dehydropantoate 2-reductase
MRIGIVGAGAVGGYLAVALSAAGQDVVMLGRRSVDEPSRMRIVRASGGELAAGTTLVATRDPGALARAELCLVAVKAQHTAAVAQQLAGLLPDGTPVLSFQNGLRNLERLRSRLTSNPVLGAVVGFNVVRDGSIRRQATAGKWMAERARGIPGARVRQLGAALGRVGERLELRRDIEGAIAGKLLINLGNGVAAVTGLPTSALLASGDARWCFAQSLREGLHVMHGAGLRPARVTLLPPAWLARALLWPDGIVAPLSRLIAAIDPAARASTLQDLERGEATEIDELNGAIVWLAEKSGHNAPINRLITNLVHALERDSHGGGAPAFLDAHVLRRRIEPLLEAGYSASRSRRNSGRPTSRTVAS